MILEFLKPFGELKSGSIADSFADGTKFSDGLCRTLIQEGNARETSEMAQTRAMLLADAERRHQEVREETRTLLQGKGRGTGKPPGGKELNDALNLDSVSTSEPVYEQGKKTFSDVLRCIFYVGSKGAPSDMVEFASNRLRHVYSEERVD